jgi:3-oxosteroid 1-dehydrogenase
VAGFDRETDLLVLGSGIAGCAAALAGREFGMAVLLIEKSRQLGGMTTQSGGVIWTGAYHFGGQAQEREDALAYLRYLSGGVHEEDKLLAFADGCGPAMDFFRGLGIGLRLARGYPDIFYPDAAGSKAEGHVYECEPFAMDQLGPWKERVRRSLYWRSQPRGATYNDLLAWGGPTDPTRWDRQALARRNAEGDQCGFGYGLLGWFLHAALERGAEILAGTGADELLRDGNGRVCGVRLADGRAIGARGAVIIATGGYGANHFLARQLDEVPDWSSSAPREQTGDGLIMAAEAGAAIRRITPNISLGLGFPADEPDGTEFRTASSTFLNRPHSIMVNAEGRRFADESSFQTVAGAMARFDVKSHRFVNRPVYLVFDQQLVERFGLSGFGVEGELPDWIRQADSIEELAEELGLPAGALAETVERFSAMADAGQDTDFHRGELRWAQLRGIAQGGNPSLGSIRQAPFYGVRLRTGGIASAGVLTNAQGQVLTWRERPIPGLYCLGDASARTEYGVGYQAGLNLSSGITFAHIATRAIQAGV